MNTVFSLGIILFSGHVLFAQKSGEEKEQASPSQRGQQQQRQPMMEQLPQVGGGSAAMVVEDGSVFVVWQGQLLKYDAKTLEQQAKTMVASPKEGGFPGGMSRSGEGGTPGGPEGSNHPSGGGPGAGRGTEEGGRSGGGGGSPMGGPQMMGGGGAAISVSNGSVYVVSQGKLSRYDEKTLQLQGSVDLMPKPEQAKPKKQEPKHSKTEGK